MIEVSLASVGFEAAVHVLACVGVPAHAPSVTLAASLFSPGYVAWAKRSLPPEAWEPACADALALSSLLGAASGGHLLQLVLSLSDSPDSLARSASLDLGALTTDDPRARGLDLGAVEGLRTLASEGPQARALVELTRCTLGLVARPYACAFAAVARELEAARAAVLSSLEGEAGEAAELLSRFGPQGLGFSLSHALGPRGRVLEGHVVVGAPVAWWAGRALDVVVQAVHEHSVARASALLEARGELSPNAAQAWASSEALALEAARLRLRSRVLAQAHERFVRRHDTSGLPPVDSALAWATWEPFEPCAPTRSSG